MPPLIDVVIVGGGPAGLSAALVLGRCLRSVVVIDNGEGRNKRAAEIHGYLTRDATPPSEFLAVARAETARYGVTIVRGTVTYACKAQHGTFAVRYQSTTSDPNQPESPLEIATNAQVACRGLLLATGVRDVLPTIEGIMPFYGTSVHHCPYCDGWEHRARRLVAYGKGDAAIGLALSLRTWSAHVVACTDGVHPGHDHLEQAAIHAIPVRHEPVVRLEGRATALERVVLADGPPIECDALFFNTGQGQRSDLPRLLGCTFKPDGGVETDDRQFTGVDGLYLAGDAAKDVQFVVVAAAEGATAAVAINHRLQELDRLSKNRLELTWR
jgi:thioredoxin reductase